MAGTVALGLLAGSVGTMAVAPAEGDLPAAQRRACERIVEALPDEVGGLPREEVNGNPLAAAWGDPPVVLRCGVPSPADFTPVSACQEINGVVWFVPEGQITDQGLDVLATTMSELPRVEVAVPAELRPPQGILTDLSDALRAQGRTPDPDEPCRS